MPVHLKNKQTKHPCPTVAAQHSLLRLRQAESVASRVSGITWVLVYRTDKYKRLKAEVEKQSKKCEYGGVA